MMDRVIKKKTWTPGRIVWLGLGIALVGTLLIMIVQRSGNERLSVDSTRLTVSRVSVGEFREYYPFDGTVVPETSVFLDVEEGGQVEEIHTEGGHWVEKGELILSISNTALQRNSIDTETRLLENLDQIRNTQFNRAQSQLALRDQLLDLDYRILELEKRFDRYKALITTDAISRDEYEATEDELSYLGDKRELLRERIRQEDLLSQQQLGQAERSIERLNTSLDLLSRIVESLEVRAPISGYLSSIDAQIGESINPGQRVGQIDLLEAFKIQVQIDQYYAADVQVGSQGHVLLGQQEYPVEVRKVYPEVINNIFMVDAYFTDAVPESIRRGQSLTLELNFGEPSESLIVRKGGFYQATNGRWAYRLADDGGSASRTDIRLGRQNPQFVEVLAGLEEGDRIITSGYGAFNDIDELVFDEAIEN